MKTWIHPAFRDCLDALGEPPIDLEDPVDRVVLAIYTDVTDRRGWRQEWDQFDEDVRAEIVRTWRAKIRGALEPLSDADRLRARS